MEFSTVEDIEEMTIKLAYCSMKSRSEKQLNSLWNISLLINQAVDQDDNYNAKESEVYHPNWQLKMTDNVMTLMVMIIY